MCLIMILEFAQKVIEMEKPLVSIIIPVYNAVHTVQDIVMTILDEKFHDFELILVDDGSTDNTPEVLRKLENKDSRVKVITKKNGGPSSARNAGLEKASGEYLIFFDADDNIMPGSLQILVDAIQKTNSDLIVSGWQIDTKKHTKQSTMTPKRVSINYELLKPFVIRSLGINGTLYNLWNKVFRADIIRSNDLHFREDLRFGEDLIFGLHYMEHVRQLNIIPDVTYRYLAGNEGGVFSSSSLSPDYRRINTEELDRFAGHNRTPELNDLTNWVLWRWQLSYWIIVAGAKKIPLSQKLGLIRQNHDDNLVVTKNSKYIGAKKLWMERIANVVRRVPILAFLLGKALHLLKRLIIYIKSTIR